MVLHTLETHDDPRGLITQRVFFITDFVIVDEFCATVVQEIVDTLSMRPRPGPHVPDTW